MNLIIDTGNTLTKLAVFKGDEILHRESCKELTEEVLDSIFVSYPAIDKAVMSSVGVINHYIEKYFEARNVYFIWVNESTPIPLVNNYGSPSTLGVDRLMAAVGAHMLYGGKELLIVDMGSAITIDRVSSKGEFLGGNISMGMEMRFKALHHFTARLPLCTHEGDYSECGKSTEEALRGGVILGIKNEIDGYISSFLEKNAKNMIIFTGGDAKYFVNKLKNTIFAECDLLLKGLNKVLEYNYDKN